MSENNHKRETILLIDDEPDLLESCRRILEDEDCDCVTTTDSLAALDLAREVNPSVVVTDFKMPGKDGMQILREINSEFPDTPVVMISAFATIEGAVEAVKLGAFDYLTKPFSSDQMIITIRRALERRRLKLENTLLKTKLKDDFFNHFFVGKHPRFLKIVELIKRVAQTESNILIHGETGTGKELIARAIHIHSKRADNPFLVVDSTTLTKEMLEAAPASGKDQAERSHKSIFEAANGGTLFLEKTEDMELGMQARLLRVLQDRKTARSGEWEWVPVDVRVIASSTSDLQTAMSMKQFRENLYYFLNVVNIHVPPLRERKEDIGILCDHFLNQLADRENTRPKALHHETLDKLMDYEWPGNVRELRGVIEMASSLTEKDTLMVSDLPDHVRRSSSLGGLTFKDAKHAWVERFEKNYLENLLLTNNGNISRASETAGIARMSLYRMLKRNDLIQFANHERSSMRGRAAKKETGS